MELATWDQILDGAGCISLHANTPGKGKNPSVLLPAMGKLYVFIYPLSMSRIRHKVKF